MGHTHGRSWTRELIKSEIMKVVDGLGLSTFPTHSEIKSFYGNAGLTVKISRTGGTREWATALGLPIKRCESELGNDFELLAMQIIAEKFGYECAQTKPRYPYDILINGNIKVDVKVSYPYRDKNSQTNSFNLEKKEPTCDIFILFCLDNNSQIAKTIIIPSCILSGQTQVGVGVDSKYDKYIDNWIIFEQYNSFYSKLIG